MQLPRPHPTPGDSDLANGGGVQAPMFSKSPMGRSEPWLSLKSTAFICKLL